ncbi:hypothetical protein NHG29_03810 [Aerococcaceae bacterium NML160702]|nr:hypothetical protein [Aerococcaceae bacterium NML160702]
MKYRKLVSFLLLGILSAGCQPKLRNYIKPIEFHNDEIELVTARTGLKWGSGELHLQDGVKRVDFIVKAWSPEHQTWEDIGGKILIDESAKEIRRFALAYDVFQKKLHFTMEANETVSAPIHLDEQKQQIEQLIRIPEQINYELDTFIPLAVIGAPLDHNEKLDFSQMKEMTPEKIVESNPNAVYYVAGIIFSEEEY